ncbi:MAG: hypothetical protein U0Z26_13865 [Anaerolineales bacterium]
MQEIKEIGLTIHDLIDGNADYIEDYLNLYSELFPEYVRYLPLMRHRAQKPLDVAANERWHQWLLLVQNEPVGMIGFLYNKKRNVGVLMDFAIKPKARTIEYPPKQSFAKLNLLLAMQKLCEDSQLNGYSCPLFMIAEVEHSRLLEKYMEYGYLKFPVEYFEPPFPPELVGVSVETQNLDKMEYKQMYLGAFQVPGFPFNPNTPSLIETALLTMLVDHYGLPLDHQLTQKALSEIPN